MQGFNLCPFLEKSFLGRVLENCRFVDRKGGRPHIFANCAGFFFFPLSDGGGSSQALGSEAPFLCSSHSFPSLSILSESSLSKRSEQWRSSTRQRIPLGSPPSQARQCLEITSILRKEHGLRRPGLSLSHC